MIEIIRRLDDSGELKTLVQKGFITTKAIIYYQIWLEVDKRRRTTKKSRMQIITEVAEQFRASHMKVYRALNSFEDESGSINTDERRQAEVS